MSERLALLGIAIVAVSGVAGVLMRRSSMAGQWVTTLLAVIGSTIGLAAVVNFWIGGESHPILLPWQIPGAEFSVAMDGLSALFLLPVFLVSLLGNIYGLAYWKQTDHPENGRKLRLFYGLLTAGMAMVVIARNGTLFLFAWEAMALSAFFLVTTEEQKTEAREAGWIYLVATHVATLSLFALFAMLRAATGSFALTPVVQGTVSPQAATAIFALALVGFGLKAGIMPLHVWLPSSHAIAPSHVSSIMSGVIIKMGIYGLVRITSLFPNAPLEWGALVLGLGTISGILGVAFAIGQHDLKRLLAYHSIENVGIIAMGLGLGLIGRSLGRADLIILGLCGGLLHVWNHAFFKGLLFFSAGSVIHATHTREIDHLGGLAKTMPATAWSFLIGAVAICGLPPLNGFVSEFLVYLGLFSTLGDAQRPTLWGAAFAAPALAMIGALAVGCFVKVYGAVFLGTARSDHARQSSESPVFMLVPMGALIISCFAIGLAPLLVAPILASAVSAWAPELHDSDLRLLSLAPLGSVMVTNLALTAALFFVGAILWARLRIGVMEKGPTWGCGYAVPTPRMQYTSSSFAQMLVGLFSWALRPQVKTPNNMTLFPRRTEFRSEVPDTVLDDAVIPAFRFGAWLFSRFRVFQGGSIQAYLLYIFFALIALLLWR